MPRPEIPKDPVWRAYWLLLPLLILAVTLLIAAKPKWMVLLPSKVTVPIMTHDVPPYHVITEGDIGKKTINASDVATDTIREWSKLTASYTLDALRANQPIRDKQVAAIPNTGPITPTLALTNTFVTAIPVDSVLALGDTLQPGDVVSIATVPISGTAAPAIILNEVIVLDIRSGAKGTVVIVALSPDEWLMYLDKVRNATPVLARRVR